MVMTMVSMSGELWIMDFTDGYGYGYGFGYLFGSALAFVGD